MQQFEQAEKIKGLDKPRVWSVLTPLSHQLKAANLGQGFPEWNPPDFYLQTLKQEVTTGNNLLMIGNHQYIRSGGTIPLLTAIAQYHKKSFQPIILNPIQNILTTIGATQALFCCFFGLINQGEQVILFDPCYDCYRPQIQMAGGKSIGLPLKPKFNQTKQIIQQRIKKNQGKVQATEEDQWEINFDLLEKSINEKTKIILINSPHNPTGKVFRQEELYKIAQILKKYPKIVVIQDNVYDGMVFDQGLGKQVPKIIRLPGFYQRTISIYSAGKIFAATGVRMGWAIGPKHLISTIKSVHQYNTFCFYGIIENTIAKSLQKIQSSTSSYMVQYAKKLQNLRNLLVLNLLKTKFDILFWIPKGCNFIIVDISKCKVQQKYLYDEQGVKRAYDYAFSLQLVHEQGVSVIPCSPFYDEQNKDKQNYIRLTFCKSQSTINQAGKRIKNKQNQ